MQFSQVLSGLQKRINREVSRFFNKRVCDLNETIITKTKEPHVRVTECGDFAVNLRLYFWVEKPNKAWITSYDLIEEIKKEFDKQGIEIPFPYRTIVYKKDLEEKKKKNK